MIICVNQIKKKEKNLKNQRQINIIMKFMFHVIILEIVVQAIVSVFKMYN